MKKAIFAGSGVALVTPFHESGIDFDKLGELIEFQITNHTDALIICGTTGESATMPDAEHISAVEYAVKKAAGRVPVIAGAGSNDTAHGIELCREAEKAGADGLLLVTPYYNKCTQKGLIRHFKMLAESVKIPVILYNVPSRTGVNILPKTMAELSKVENIVGVKEATGDLVAAMEIRKLCGEDFAIYSGNDDNVVPIMAVGAKGVISVAANLLPQQIHDLCQLCLDKKFDEAAKMQIELFDLNKALFVEVNPIPVKTALNLMGWQVGTLRMPLCEMEEEHLEILKKAMAQYGVPMKA